MSAEDSAATCDWSGDCYASDTVDARTPSPTSPTISPASPAASENSSNSAIQDDARLVDRELAPEQRVSIYVLVFEEMLQIVMERESYLFNHEEAELLRRFSEMSCKYQLSGPEDSNLRRITIYVDAARYLFVRLFSRKNGWFRTKKLAYFDEIGDMQKTVDELCRTSIGKGSLEESQGRLDVDIVKRADGVTAGLIPTTSVTSAGIALVEEIQIIGDRDTGAASRTMEITDPLVNRPLNEMKKDMHEFGLSRFAINEGILAERADVNELLSLLSLDELKVAIVLSDSLSLTESANKRHWQRILKSVARQHA